MLDTKENVYLLAQDVKLTIFKKENQSSFLLNSAGVTLLISQDNDIRSSFLASVSFGISLLFLVRVKHPVTHRDDF